MKYKTFVTYAKNFSTDENDGNAFKIYYEV